MNKPIQAAAPSKPTALKADPAPVGKAVVPSKSKAAVVPITASDDIKLPGDNAVRAGISRRTGEPFLNLVIDPPNGARPLGGSDWPAFNQVLLETVLVTIPANNPDAVPNRIVAASAALAAFRRARSG
jgi:hypothetical protein